MRMLGWPLTRRRPAAPPAVREEPVATDELGSIARLWITTLPGLELYGILFTPPGPGPHPLVISQHGGGGTPELCSGFFGSANYNDQTRRVLRRGCAVFAPQLGLWNDTYGPPNQRDALDRQLKQLGGSVAGLDVYQLSRALDHLLARPGIDGTRAGMIGLSWGGFYTLLTAALEPRLRAALASCYFSERTVYDHPPAVWFGAAQRFFDAELAALVCPRALCVEVGAKDTLFDVKHAGPEAAKVTRTYAALGLGDRWRYVEHPGGHELDKDDASIEFLVRHLRA